MHQLRINDDAKRWLFMVAATVLLVSLSNCGGGGGGTPTPPPSNQLTISGVVLVPSGTPRSRALTGAALPNATVRAYLALQLGSPIAQTVSDSDGRYTLSVPSDYIGRDLLIVAEKEVGGERVRAATLTPALPPQGYAGANLDAYTTLATEEILRYARQQNLNALSPNGVASVVDRVRELLRDRDRLSLVVGQTLPENIGDGIVEPQLREQVRARVVEQGQNLRPPTGDVAVAKGMTQMLRDYGSGWLDRGNEEILRLEQSVQQQERVIERDIIEPLEQLGERGGNFVVRVLGLDERKYDDSLDGLPPARYRETQQGGRYVLTRIGNAPNDRTWIVESGQLTCTVTTSNPLQEFRLNPDAGRVNFTVRKQGDARFQYDGFFEVSQRDSEGNPTQLRAQMNLADAELREPIRFNGVMDVRTGPQEGDIDYAKLSGTLQSQYADLNITNLESDTYSPSRNQKLIKAARVQATLKTERGPNLDLQNLSVSFADADPADKNLQQFTVQSLTFSAENRTLLMREVEAQFQRVGSEPQPVRLRAQVEYRTPNDTLVGTINARWENPTAENPLELRTIPLEQFPRGNFEFNGNLTPRIGRRALIYFNVVPEPDLSPARVRIVLRLDLGEERMQGEFVGNLRVQDGCVNRSQPFETATLQMNHTPSNLRMTLRYDAETDTASGDISKPDGTAVAQIGKASALGLPDLGDAYLVRYMDNTFETVNSLLFLED